MASGEISVRALIEEAIGRTGLDRLGSAHFEQFLDAWCADLRSAALSESGRAFLARQATRNLETRLRVLETIRLNPEIEDVPLPRIVRIMGFPRSGTTFLHNLMALHPDARALLRWELIHPVPPPEASTYATDPRIDKAQRSLAALRGTELERMHWVEATDPEECTWGFFDLSGLMGRGLTTLMPRWTEAVFDASTAHVETYEEYRRLVKLLLWRNPLPESGVLILKCPTDTDQIRTFLDVFPEAQLVLCHRDPFRTLTSSCRTQEVISRPHLASPTAINIGAADERMFEIHRDFADSMVAAAAAMPDRIASVRYAELMASPSEVVVGAFQALSVTVDPSQMQRDIASFVADQRQGRRARPPTGYDDYGYAASQIRSHPSMAAYIETFGVPDEEVRISGPVEQPAAS